MCWGGGGSNWARGQGGRLGPGSRAKPWWGVLGATDGKRFSVFEMPLEGSPLSHFVNFSLSVLVLITNNTLKISYDHVIDIEIFLNPENE